MRKRIRVKYEKILSCTGKNIILYSLVVLLAMCMCSSEQERGSWEIYCEKYGVNVDNPTQSQEIYYLDCYVGSVEEENDINR